MDRNSYGYLVNFRLGVLDAMTDAIPASAAECILAQYSLRDIPDKLDDIAQQVVVLILNPERMRQLEAERPAQVAHHEPVQL